MKTTPTNRIEISFAALDASREATTVLLAGKDMALSEVGRAMDEKSDGLIVASATAADFTGKAKSFLDILAPRGLDEKRVIVCGIGANKEVSENDWINLGGTIMSQLLSRKIPTASIVCEPPLDGADVSTAFVAGTALGAQLRHYKFGKYKTKESDTDEADAKQDGVTKLVFHCADPEAASKAFIDGRAIANGVHLARDLVNEPANSLGPVELADAAKSLEEFGMNVDILVPDELTKLGMGALLGVAQGSERPARVAVMRWQGADDAGAPPVAFVGKGVVFDTGGISIKGAQGMEDMKGDMGGAATVVGLMRTLAERKAKVNAVGLIGCVENMPSHNAQRPGDVVTSMSGQTIEVINTDAEGRLVLADVVWYAQERFKPKFVIDLATLTGAIMVALGKEYAGLYASDDALSEQILEASKTTGEKVWRMPLDKAYDKLIDSKFADMKNIGGRWGGACTAAQFIKRFVKDDTPWVHIDLAGTAMDSGRNDINQSWGSGWGVRLLNQVVVDHYEAS
ncbi:MAG: leucyl aminopeptidase [Pseudomonadota bacterium]